MKCKFTFSITAILLITLTTAFAHTLEVDLITDTDRTWGWVNNEKTNEYAIIQKNYYHRFHKVGDVIPTLNDTLDSYWGVWLDGRSYDNLHWSNSTTDRSKELQDNLKVVFGNRFKTGCLPNLTAKYLVGSAFSTPVQTHPTGGTQVQNLWGDQCFVASELPNIKGSVTAGFLNTQGTGAGTFPYYRAFSSASEAFSVFDNSDTAIARWTSGVGGKDDTYKKFDFDASRCNSTLYKTGGGLAVAAVRVRYKTIWTLPPAQESVLIRDVKNKQDTAKAQNLKVVTGCKYPGLIDWVSPRSTQGVTSRAIHAFFMMNFASNKFSVAIQEYRASITHQVTESNAQFIEDNPDEERTAATQEWVKNNFMRKPAFFKVDDYVSKTSTNAVSSRAVFKFISDSITNLTAFTYGNNPAGSGVDLNEYALKAEVSAVSNKVNVNAENITELQNQIGFLNESLTGSTNSLPTYAKYSEMTNYVDEAFHDLSNSIEFTIANRTNRIESAVYLYDAKDEFDMLKNTSPSVPRVWKIFVFDGILCVKDVSREAERNNLSGKFEDNWRTGDEEE